MIVIDKPYVIEKDDRAYLKANIRISENTYKNYMQLQKRLPKTNWRVYENYPPQEWDSDSSGLWFSVEKEYNEYLCTDRADAFVVAMLWYAIMTHSDIKSIAPVSERIAFNIRNHLIPALCIEDKGYRRINLDVPTINCPYPTKSAVATGMSCGVDSLYSASKYTSKLIPKRYRLTHMAYFNMGAIFHLNTAANTQYGVKEFYEITDKMSDEKCQNARNVANYYSLPLVYVKSNLDSDFYRGAYGYTGVYRNCAMVLALQGLFGTYYCSSAGWPSFFDLSLSEGSEHYETLLCDTFSNDNLSFIISDYVSRFEKTKELADTEVAHKFLDVCFNFNNCGTCAKCYRTLITLDILGKIDNFSSVFNLDEYAKNRISAYVWLLHTKDGNELDDNAVFAKEIYYHALQKGSIPLQACKEYRKEKIINAIQHFYRVVKRTVKRILLYFIRMGKR